MSRWIVLGVALIAGLAILFLALPWRDFASSAKSKVAWQLQAGTPDLPDVMVEMPDGTRLATDVYLPGTAGPAPVVVMRLPYGKRYYGEVRFWVQELTRRGFGVVAQDMRGRHGSEGVFAPYANAGPDGAATLDWITGQPWSNGKVGTLGCSALGESQLMLAAQAHPAHRAMVPIAPGGAIGEAGGKYAYFSAFEGGIFNLAAGVGWFGAEGGKTSSTSGHLGIGRPALDHLPIIDIVGLARPDQTDYEAFLENFENPDYWRDMGYVSGSEPFATPALFIDTWHDLGIGSTLALADTLRRAGAPVSAIIGAGTHCGYLGTDGPTTVGDLAINPKTAIGYVDVISRFLAHHLADGPSPNLPNLTYYTLAEDEWRTADNWPTQTAHPYPLFLGGDGSLTGTSDNVDPAPRAFLSDPANPVPSIGGAICCTGDPDERSGPVLQNMIETREDVLLYSSDPLPRALRIAGPVRLELRVSASTPDTDIVARLVDVDPDGNALLIQEGALRLRYRDGFDSPKPLQAGETYRITVDMRDIAYLFEKGHRLRLHVAGTSFPRLERNLNTGNANYAETEMRVSEITVHSDPGNPSVLRLHALPD